VAGGLLLGSFTRPLVRLPPASACERRLAWVWHQDAAAAQAGC
jgi:hypothetical protein